MFGVGQFVCPTLSVQNQENVLFQRYIGRRSWLCLKGTAVCQSEIPPSAGSGQGLVLLVKTRALVMTPERCIKGRIQIEPPRRILQIVEPPRMR
jgi:hypothetical protein